MGADLTWSLVVLQVSMGDEGLSQCAGKCDTESGCVGYSMTETGMCNMLKAINVGNSYSCCQPCDAFAQLPKLGSTWQPPWFGLSVTSTV